MFLQHVEKPLDSLFQFGLVVGARTVVVTQWHYAGLGLGRRGALVAVAGRAAFFRERRVALVRRGPRRGRPEEPVELGVVKGAFCRSRGLLFLVRRRLGAAVERREAFVRVGSRIGLVAVSAVLLRVIQLLLLLLLLLQMLARIIGKLLVVFLAVGRRLFEVVVLLTVRRLSELTTKAKIKKKGISFIFEKKPYERFALNHRININAFETPYLLLAAVVATAGYRDSVTTGLWRRITGRALRHVTGVLVRRHVLWSVTVGLLYVRLPVSARAGFGNLVSVRLVSRERVLEPGTL